MATLPYNLANGQTADGNQTMSNFTELATNITNDNIASNASIAWSKLAADAWTTYTSTWASSGTQPAIVNGTIVARYQQLGKVVFFSIKLTTGTSTTFGTGSYTFSLPVAAKNDTVEYFVNGRATESGGSSFPLTGTIGPGDSTLGLWVHTANTTWAQLDALSTSTPFTWGGAGDLISISGVYQVA